MSKEFKLVKQSEVAKVQKPPVDWTLCILCQKASSETLQQPWKGQGRGRGGGDAIAVGYQSFASNLAKFKDFGQIPFGVTPDQFDDGSGVVQTLQNNKAAWHKTCRNMFSDLKLERLQKRALEPEATDSSAMSPVKLRRSSGFPGTQPSERDTPVCFFCGKGAGIGGLHEVRTMGMDHTIRKYATELNDTELLAKLAPGDMVALEAKYHKGCLSDLHNRCKHVNKYRSLDPTVDTASAVKSQESIALAELISYIDERRMFDTAVPVFRLADLVAIYTERLLEFNPDVNVNSTRLKDRLLLHCPYLKAVNQGRDVLLTYDTAVGDAILKACSDEDSEAISLARTARIVRKELFSCGHSFDGSLCTSSDDNIVPGSLTALINMILDGPSIKSQARRDVASSQATRTISELIVFNSVRVGNRPRKENVRHNSDREMPTPVYIGLKVHGKTRNRDLIDCLHKHGLSISYDRVLRISSSIAMSIITRFENDGVVCPPQLKKGLFTTGQVDNIDHNPSATTATDSFHGTAHSLCQHPTNDNSGTDREPIVPATMESEKRIPSLPLAYTNIRPAPPMPSEIQVPTTMEGPCIPPGMTTFDEDRKKEFAWLNKQLKLVEEGEITGDDFVSWAAYHASRHLQSCRPPTSIALMPLFREVAHSFATILHCMETNRAATHFLNPGQTPVLTMDQPLYAIGKQLQWRFPDLFGESKYVMMMGPLHTEMAALKVIGDLLEGCGWTDVIVQADIATKGTADSFIHASHVAKTRRVHQITASALYILQRQAFERDKEASDNDDTQTEDTEHEAFITWRGQMCRNHPMFHFWNTVLELQMTLFAFVRAIRTSNFELYVETMSHLVPWFFALDHVHYARWISVHIRDMNNLRQLRPDVHEQFEQGAFTSNKTRNPFSAIGLDHAHEQLNAQIKGDGGAIGLTENPGALRRWMVAGPQLATIIEEYEESRDVSPKESKTKHHEQSTSQQKSFADSVRSLVSTLDEMGNPFLDRSKDLYTIHSQDVMPASVVKSLEEIQTLGTVKYQTFVEKRLQKNEVSLSAPISRNSLPLFSRPKLVEKSKDKQKIAELKSDCSLFSRLYISSQSRDGDLQEFFKHENQTYPPSLSSSGKLKEGKKSDLIGCFEATIKHLATVTTAPPVDVKVLDGAAVVHFLPVGESRNFGEYANDVFIPHVLKQLEKTQRVDLVWDVYLENSLKLSARMNRGSGARKRVASNVVLPQNWKNFLRNDDNKDDLFQFLGHECVSKDTGDKVIISTIKMQSLPRR